MPKFTIDLTDKALARLQAEVDRTNGNQGTALTVTEWLNLHVAELCIADDLAAAVQRLVGEQQKDAQAALDAAIRTARDELLASLADPAVAGSGPE